MDPQRKRKIRLVVALSAAVLLAVALVYTSFSAATDAKEPSQLIGAAPGTTYDMTGKVVPGSIRHRGNGIAFRVADREGGGRAPCPSPTPAPSPIPSAAAARSSSPERWRAAPSSANRKP